MSDYQLHVFMNDGTESDTLRFYARDKGAALACEVDGCTRAGRYTIEILGFPVLSRRRIRSNGQAELVCSECAREMRDAWIGALEPSGADIPEKVAA